MHALNFKKALNKSPNMIALRLGMRDEYRKRLRNLTIEDLNDPNRNIVDANEGDNEFRKLINKMLTGLKVQHVQPEEIVIMQSDSILNDDVEPV